MFLKNIVPKIWTITLKLLANYTYNDLSCGNSQKLNISFPVGQLWAAVSEICVIDWWFIKSFMYLYKSSLSEKLKYIQRPEADLGLLQHSRWSARLAAVNYYHKALHLGCCSSPRPASGDVFRALSNIWDREFCENIYRRKAVDYFLKTLNFTCWQGSEYATDIPLK